MELWLDELGYSLGISISHTNMKQQVPQQSVTYRGGQGKQGLWAPVRCECDNLVQHKLYPTAPGVRVARG